MSRLDADTVRQEARGRWLYILPALAPALAEACSRPGKHVPCPVHGGKDGFRLFEDASDTGGGICNTCGPRSDGFALLEWITGKPFRDVLEDVARYIGAGALPTPENKMTLPDTGQRRAALRRVWRATRADDGTIASYLRHRGLSGAVPESLRLHPALTYRDGGKVLGTYPAMIAVVVSRDRKPVSIHRTYLAPGGAGKAPVPAPKKLMTAIRDGATSGGAIRLADAGEWVAVTEGIETALAVMEATDTPTWATVSAPGMRALQLPDHIRHVDIWADNDPIRGGKRAGQDAASSLADRLTREGRTVRVMIPEREGEDWLDVLNRDGAGALRQAMEAAGNWEPRVAEDAIPSTEPGDLATLLKPLTELEEDSNLPAIEAALRRVAAGAPGLDPLGRAALRESILAELKRLKVKSPAKLTDAALSVAAADGGSDGKQGSPVIMGDPEPWPEPVDGAGLLDELAATFRRYLALPDGADVALPLWVLHTYVFDAFPITPRLGFTSATKRCGKTTAQTLTGQLVPRPLTTANITTAALFRAVEAYKPTVLIDEADTFLEERQELRGLLNAGHFRPTAYVIRTVGEDHEVRVFSVWAPASVALIGSLPSTLADRSIEIRMRRKNPDERVERLRLDRLDELEPLRRKAARWAQDNMEALAHIDPEVPSELHDRAADNWRPLLAIAEVAGGDWPKRARQAALVLSGAVSEDGDIGPELLADIYDVFKERGKAALASAALVDALVDMKERPWATYRRGNPLTAHQLARLLAPFDIRPKKIRFGERVAQGYAREQFKDAWRRYPPRRPEREMEQDYTPSQDPAFKAEQPEQADNEGVSGAFEDRNNNLAVPVGESGQKVLYDGIVPGVPVQTPEVIDI